MAWEQFGRYLLTARAMTGMEAARARLRLSWGTWEPVASMLRENSKWKHHKKQSTDAGRRGRSARKSDEAW